MDDRRNDDLNERYSGAERRAANPDDVLHRNDPEHVELLKNTRQTRRTLEGFWDYTKQPPVRVTGLLEEVHDLNETVHKFTDGFAATIKWVGGIISALLTLILGALLTGHH